VKECEPLATGLSGSLTVGGAATMSTTLAVMGAAAISSTLVVTGAAALSSTLGVTGITTLADDLKLSEDIAALTHTGTTGLAITSTSGYVDVEDLRFTGAAIGVSGTPTVVTVASGGAAVTGTLSATSSTHLSSTLGVAGITTLADDLIISEDAAVLTHTGTTGLAITSTSGYVDVEDLRFTGTQIGTSSVPNVIAVSDAGVVITGSLSSTSFSFEGDFAVGANKFTVEAISGNTAVAGTLAVAGAFAPSSLGVTGAATVGTTLTVTGDFVVGADKFTVEATSGNTAVAGTLAVAGDTTLSTLQVTGAADLSSTIAVGGAAALSSTLVVGRCRLTLSNPR